MVLARTSDIYGSSFTITARMVILLTVPTLCNTMCQIMFNNTNSEIANRDNVFEVFLSRRVKGCDHWGVSDIYFHHSPICSYVDLYLSVISKIVYAF